MLSAGCRPSVPTPAGGPSFTGPGWFEDVTDEVGLDFVHDAGPTDGTYFMPQIIGSGAALFDFDGDGRLDILPAPERRPRLGLDQPAVPAAARRHVSRTSATARAWTSPATTWAWPSATSTTTAGPTCSSPSTAASSCSSTTATARSPTSPRRPAWTTRLGHVGRLLRLRPRRLARPRRRQLRRLRPLLALRRRRAASRITAPRTRSRARSPGCSTTSAAAGGGRPCASRT